MKTARLEVRLNHRQFYLYCPVRMLEDRVQFCQRDVLVLRRQRQVLLYHQSSVEPRREQFPLPLLDLRRDGRRLIEQPAEETSELSIERG